MEGMSRRGDHPCGRVKESPEALDPGRKMKVAVAGKALGVFYQAGQPRPDPHPLGTGAFHHGCLRALPEGSEM